jgi:hypothetical protein
MTTRGTAPWQLMPWRTYDLLKFLGHTAYNYESHTPIRVGNFCIASASTRSKAS